VCLTVEAYGEGYFEVFTAAETRDRTYLGDLEAGDRVNVERALPARGTSRATSSRVMSTPRRR
jgi:riboflavin synthase